MDFSSLESLVRSWQYKRIKEYVKGSSYLKDSDCLQRSVKVLQSFKLDSSQNLLSCTYDSMTAKTCNKGEMFFGVDAAGTPICRQFPKCAGGSILQGMDSDGNPICVDGRGIANLPAPTVIYQPVAAASSPTPSVYDSKTATTPTVTVATTAAPPVEKIGPRLIIDLIHLSPFGFALIREGVHFKNDSTVPTFCYVIESSFEF